MITFPIYEPRKLFGTKRNWRGCSYLVLQSNYDVLDKLGYATRLYNTILHLTSFNQIKAAAHMEK